MQYSEVTGSRHRVKRMLVGKADCFDCLFILEPDSASDVKVHLI